MRTYTPDSPHAAARVVALVLLADGHVGRTELQALERSAAAREMGLPALAVPDLLRELSEDLLATGSGPWDGRGAIDEDFVAGVLDDVRDPVLRRQVLALAVAVAQADGHFSENERSVLATGVRRWGLAPAAVEAGHG